MLWLKLEMRGTEKTRDAVDLQLSHQIKRHDWSMAVTSPSYSRDINIDVYLGIVLDYTDTLYKIRRTHRMSERDEMNGDYLTQAVTWLIIQYNEFRVQCRQLYIITCRLCMQF